MPAQQRALIQPAVVLAWLLHLRAAIFEVVQHLALAQAPVLRRAVGYRLLEVRVEAQDLCAQCVSSISSRYGVMWRRQLVHDWAHLFVIGQPCRGLGVLIARGRPLLTACDMHTSL